MGSLQTAGKMDSKQRNMVFQAAENALKMVKWCDANRELLRLTSVHEEVSFTLSFFEESVLPLTARRQVILGGPKHSGTEMAQVLVFGKWQTRGLKRSGVCGKELIFPKTDAGRLYIGFRETGFCFWMVSSSYMI